MKVFVYGTLKRAYGNSRIFKRHDSQFIEERVLPGYKLLFSFGQSGFPVAVPSENSYIKGEVWDITNNAENCIRDLDFLESEGQMYNRIQVEDNLYMYLGHPDNWPYKEMKECPCVNNIYVWRD